jgi:CHAD domain-containing protein
VAVSSSREVERKFEAPEQTPVPDRLGDGYTVEAADELHLVATYYDTEHLRLLRHGATLRYRTGDSEPGWHLKVAAGGDARQEIHAAGPPEHPPTELLALVRPHLGCAAPVAVAELRTTRLQRGVADRGGRRVASLDDDEVSGRRAADGLVVAWRELEAELTPGTDDGVLDELADGLRRAGWEPSGGVSKIGRVLTNGADPRNLPVAPTVSKAAGYLLDHLDQQVTAIVAHDAVVRAGDAEAVHKMRVATRRLRSALATFRPCFDRTVTDPLRDELKWLGGVLGQVRDDHVLHARLIDELAGVPDVLVLGPVAERIRIELRGREQGDMAGVIEALDGQRYVELLDGLHRLLELPPWSAGRDGKGVHPKTLRSRATKAVDRVRQRTPKHAAKATDAELHELRKSAKRARYALEVLEPLDGKPAAQAAARFEAVQEVLGDHQDSVGARQVLRLLGAAATGRAENGFTFGLLHEAEHRRADEVRRVWPEVVHEAMRAKGLRWLDS